MSSYVVCITKQNNNHNRNLAQTKCNPCTYTNKDNRTFNAEGTEPDVVEWSFGAF